jgi:AsmA protein
MRAVRIALVAVGAVLALLAAGAIIVATTFDPNDYKGYVTDAFVARTGRTLVIDQDLELGFFPWLAVETGGITVGNAPQFGERPFATVERAAARVKLMPLLRREIELGTIELDGLALDLARDAQRRGNWQDLLDTVTGGEPADNGAGVRSLALEGIEITSGTVYWREADGLRYTVSDLALTTGAIGARAAPVDLKLSLQLKDEASGAAHRLGADGSIAVTPEGRVTVDELTATVGLTLGDGSMREAQIELETLSFDPSAETVRVDGLRTVTARLRADWRLSADTVLSSPTVTGAVAVPQTSLAAALEELRMTPPEGVAPEDLGSVTFTSDFAFRAQPRSIRLTNVEAALLGFTLRGEGTLEGGEALSGRIAIPEFAASPAVHALLRPVVPPTVDVTAIDRLALSTRFEANLATGAAAFRELDATVLGAQLRGDLEAIPGGAGNVFRGAVSTSRFETDAFARAFAQLLSDKISAQELGAVRLDARFSLDTGADALTVAPFEAEIFGLTGAGELSGRNVSRGAAWTGTLKVAEFSPQDLIRRFGLPPQPTSDERALTRASLAARLDVDANRGAFREIVLALDDSNITGDFTVEGFENPRYLFALAIDRVDADRYLPPKARDAQAGEATAGDIELPQNNTMQLDGTMTIGDLRLAGMQFQDVGARVLIGGGDAQLQNARARLYGGEFGGSFHVRAAGADPGLDLEGRATGLQLEPLIRALTGEPPNFRGVGDFELNLAGRGRTVIENVRSASGNVSFAMREGAINGFNLGRTICAAYNVTQRAPAPPEQPDETAYQAIQGTARVEAGTAHSQDLLARTSFMDIYGAGALVLVEQTLDYDLDAKLTGRIEIPGCETMDGLIGQSIPFDIRGTVTAPTITPDFSKLVQRAIREEVQERLQERLQDRLRDLLR